MSVRVLDGVFSNTSTASLRAFANAHYRTSSSEIRGFSRGGPHRNLLEAALDSFLDHVGDSGTVVEYWRRARWEHVGLHRDIDEKLARTGRYHHPSHGHVLYLDIGRLVVGPTALFWTDALHGGDWLTTVPAVPGRVLRFNGSLLHAVPRPHDAWLLPERGLQPGLERRYSAHTPDAPERRRDVILFNVWDEAPSGLTPGEAGALEPEVAAQPPTDWSEHVARKMDREHSLDAERRGERRDERPQADVLRVDMLGDCVRRGRDEGEIRMRTAADVGAALGAPFEATSLPVELLGGALAASHYSGECERRVSSAEWAAMQDLQARASAAARSGADVIGDVLEEVAALLDQQPLTLGLLPNTLRPELASAFLDAGDVANARRVLQGATGPVAARVRAVLGQGELPPLYHERAQLAASERAPTPTHASELELRAADDSHVRGAGLHSLQWPSACTERACRLRGRAMSPGTTPPLLAALKATCPSLPVKLSKRASSGGVETIRIQRNGEWADEVPLLRFLEQPRVFSRLLPPSSHLLPPSLPFAQVPLLRFLEQPREGVFVHELPLLHAAEACRAALAPHFAPVPLEAVALSIFGTPSTGALQAAEHAQLVLVYKGQLEVTLFPLAGRDVNLVLYPESVLADRWNGSTREETSPCGFPLPASFPNVHRPALRRFPLLGRGLASRLVLELTAGDALVLPACLPHAIAPKGTSVFVTMPAPLASSGAHDEL